MASPVEIGRLALAHIADAARINSISPPDNTIQAQHVATFYPIARDECLEAYAWPFSQKSVPLTQSLVTLPHGEWAFVYQLPADYLRALKVVPPGAPEDSPGHRYALRSDETELDLLLFTNVHDAVLHYIYREEETGRYTPTFVTALSYLLAAHLAGPIVKGRAGMTLKQGLMDLYQQTLNSAAVRALDSAGRSGQQWGDHKPTWITDR